MAKEQTVTITLNAESEVNNFKGVLSLFIKAENGRTLHIHAPGYQGREGFTIRSMPGSIMVKPDVSNVIELDVQGSF